MKVNLPIGMDLFYKVRQENCYYIDKTGFIEELLETPFEVNLITRPRRFGKTLTMSMLAEFFDIRKDCREALEQIERRQYDKTRLKGYRTILKYGAAFFEKQCLIKTAGPI